MHWRQNILLPLLIVIAVSGRDMVELNLSHLNVHLLLEGGTPTLYTSQSIELEYTVIDLFNS